MSALRNVEDTIGGFVERVFGRLFRGHVEPVELARKLAREMEDHKTVSVSRVYVPNEYVVYLSTSDRNRFASFEGALTTELSVYLSERARHEGFTLLSEPKVTLEADTDLRVGEYGIACRVVDPPVEAPDEVDASTPDLPDPEPVPLPVLPIPVDGGLADDIAEVVSADDADELPAVGAEPLEIPALVDDAGAPDPDAPADEPAAMIETSQSVELDADPDADPSLGAPSADVEPILTPVTTEPEPIATVEPEPHDAAPVASAEPTPEISAAPVPVPPVPAAPVATPLPPPGGYEPLAGVSGTQIISAADARAEGLVQEELAIVVDGRRQAINKRTTILGRSRECDIVVHDSNASRQHAEIRHIGLDYFIVDSNSTNGTLVNGQRIRRHALAHGDRILIGTTELLVEHTA